MPASRSVDQQQACRVCVGQIAGARGLKGEFFVRAFTTDPRAIGAYGPLSNEVGDRSFRIRVLGATKNGLVVRAEGIDDRSAAEALRGTRLFVGREALPPPAEGEFYYADLIGLQAEFAGDDGAPRRLIGRVAAVHDFGAAPVLEIESAGAPSVMIPFTLAAVPEVDIAGGRLVIAPIPGLFGDSDEPGTDTGESPP